MYCTVTNDASRVNFSASGPSAEATLLWEKNEPPANPTRYNLSSFAITLNELTPNLKVDWQIQLIISTSLSSDTKA